MPSDTRFDEARRIARRFAIADGRAFHLKNISPDDDGGLESKQRAAEMLAEGVGLLNDLQEKLYAQHTWALLLVFQAMDAAGKDSTIKHVMSGVNPQGCHVSSFKAPSGEELDHDFLWRASRHLPERGRIGIFNRSYYEEVLVVRVHPEWLSRQRLPEHVLSKHIWRQRFDDIRAYEAYLHRNGVAIRKFFLHVSRKEQKQRFLERLDEPEKFWKFSSADAQERTYWRHYMRAYQDVIRHTAAPHAPWYVVPADHKWFTRVVVIAAIVDALKEMHLAFPKVDHDRRHEIAAARRLLENE